MRIFISINVRSGIIFIDESALMHIGTDGYMWSQTAGGYSAPSWFSAFHLGFGKTNSGPSSGPNYRRNGFPVRCLVILVYGITVYEYRSNKSRLQNRPSSDRISRRAAED